MEVKIIENKKNTLVFDIKGESIDGFFTGKLTISESSWSIEGDIFRKNKGLNPIISSLLT